MVKNFFIVANFLIGAAPLPVRQEFYLHFEKYISSCPDYEVLLVAGDNNSSMGTRSASQDGVLGQFGLKYCSKGKEVYDFFWCLCSTTTFFKKSQDQT